ncbi:unnamed protein product [Cladocopium goreaui]|uniref:Sushi domain-containing protein n=1 Tax=Cladocopium goreaui TaxID=2562237 RepID=A0A9P1CC33_9DINO|nr:unnamed protein product [Cladocopium goreaui]
MFWHVSLWPNVGRGLAALCMFKQNGPEARWPKMLEPTGNVQARHLLDVTRNASVRTLQNDLRGPFKSGSVLEVSCALGFRPLNESEGTWTVKCVGWNAWSATGHFGGCDVVSCSSLSDTWGTWLGAVRFNSTMRLECADGFNVEGASELHCLASGLWSHLPGQCLPNGGNPELWRSKLRYSALLSFLGIVVTITLVLWVCRPTLAEQGSYPASRQSLATE